MTNDDVTIEQNFLSGVLRRLNRRKFLIVAQTLGIFALLVVGIEMLPKSYRGVASVAIEGQTPMAAQVGDVVRDMPFDDQTIGTEVATLNTSELLADTITRTGLLKKPEFNPAIRPSGFGSVLANLRTSIHDWFPGNASDDNDAAATPSEKAMSDTIDTLRQHVKSVPVPHSRIIEIAVTASNPKLAAQIANTMADLYITNHRDYKLAASREAHQFLDTKIAELRQDADTKSAALERYRIDNGLTTAEHATVVQEQVTGLSAQLQAARTRLAELEGQAATAKSSNPEQLGAVLGSQTISRLREQEAQALSDRARFAATYGDNSPVVAPYNIRVASIRAQIAAEAHRAVQSLPNDVATARANVDSLTKRMAELRTQASTMDEARAHLATLEDDSTSARSVYNAFLSRLRATDAAMAYGATDVRVISHAAVPTRAAFPDQMIMLPAGLILSFLLAGVTAYATTRPRGLVGTGDIEMMFGDIPPLGMIPIRNERSRAHFDTAIEQLLNRLIMMDHQPKSILITSSLPAEGKTTTARALADAAMRRGMNVFLVDADMRSARMPKPRTNATTMGLSEVLRGEVDLDHAVTRRNTGSVPMLSAGTGRGNPTSLMALPTLGKTLQRLAESHDLVIVDAPPSLVGGDCEMLARVVDATIMLTKWHSTPPEIVALALKQLGKVNVAGMVLTMVDPAKIGQFGQTDAVIYSQSLHRYYQA